MSGVNKVMLLGNVGRDAEFRPTSGSSMLKFSLATSERYKNKAGEYVDDTQWHSCIMWGRRAEALSGKITKGTKLFVEGQIQYRKTDDGKFYTDIKVLNLEFVGSKGGDSDYKSGGSYQSGSASSGQTSWSGASGSAVSTKDYGPEDFGSGPDSDPIPF